jgi:hypothetical protein
VGRVQRCAERGIARAGDAHGLGGHAVTGYALPEDRRQAAEAGFDRHLAKPVSVAQIEEVLAAATAGKL